MREAKGYFSDSEDASCGHLVTRVTPSPHTAIEC